MPIEIAEAFTMCFSYYITGGKFGCYMTQFDIQNWFYIKPIIIDNEDEYKISVKNIYWEQAISFIRNHATVSKKITKKEYDDIVVEFLKTAKYFRKIKEIINK